MRRVVQEAVRQQAETGYPQAIILSGTSGAGKTHCSMLLLRQLFAVAGGGPETDAFKHLAAAFTVLRSLGSAKTTTNSESSRIVSIFFSHRQFSQKFVLHLNAVFTKFTTFTSRGNSLKFKSLMALCTEPKSTVISWIKPGSYVRFQMRKIITSSTKC